MEYSFPRYLAAKKSVDDRALNARVWHALALEMDAVQTRGSIDVLEIGAGIGTMIQRFIQAGLLHRATYTAMDAIPENIAFAQSSLGNWVQDMGWKVNSGSFGLDLSESERNVHFDMEAIDLYAFIRRELENRTWDLLVANAFLDLFDVPRLLPELNRLICPAGLAYFSINFDGVTIFEPVFDRGLESAILEAYHRTMDERHIDNRRSGDSQAGRHLFQQLPAAGFEILASGSSDWVVFSQKGVYPLDESYFLHHILHFFEESLQGAAGISPSDLARWITQRHAQVVSGELVYIAHQMDFLARAAK